MELPGDFYYSNQPQHQQQQQPSPYEPYQQQLLAPHPNIRSNSQRSNQSFGSQRSPSLSQRDSTMSGVSELSGHSSDPGNTKSRWSDYQSQSFSDSRPTSYSSDQGGMRSPGLSQKTFAAELPTTTETTEEHGSGGGGLAGRDDKSDYPDALRVNQQQQQQQQQQQSPQYRYGPADYAGYTQKQDNPPKYQLQQTPPGSKKSHFVQ
jgi:hypothetical protein